MNQQNNQMRKSHHARRVQFALFFSIFFALYGLLNYYIFWRGWHSIPESSGFRVAYAILFTVLSLSFIGGRFLERVTVSRVSSSLVWIGSFWFGAIVYFFLALLLIDTLRLINAVVPFFPEVVTRNSEGTNLVVGVTVLLSVLIVLLIGYWNARTTRIRTMDIRISKNSRPLKELNVVVASDIHLGTIIGRKRLMKIVDRINGLNPDLVLLPGDVVDEDLGPVIRQNLGETLRTIRSRYGVVSITGNHEYIGGVEEAYRYLTDHGITVLRDNSLKIAESFYVVGREDLSRKGFSGGVRKSLGEIMAGVDHSWPIIMMDHQPFRLDEAVEQGIDLQLSGHTHHGQMWPFNLITTKMYEVSWGYKKKGNTHFYVSCGVGTWGPPVRIGNTPEIVNIKITFG